MEAGQFRSEATESNPMRIDSGFFVDQPQVPHDVCEITPLAKGYRCAGRFLPHPGLVEPGQSVIIDADVKAMRADKKYCRNQSKKRCVCRMSVIVDKDR
jgi:hypothetical protein